MFISELFKRKLATVVPFITLCFWVSELPSETKGIVADRPLAGRYVETPHGFMVPYVETIPGTDITFEMIPVGDGTVVIGSPEGEAGRGPHEGPQRSVRVAPYWIGKYEVTWDQYRYYMAMYEKFKEFESRQLRIVSEVNLVDAVTAPTPLYEPDFTFKLGDKERQPAVTMTQYAAKQFTKWLSAITNCFYRLPSEIEWENACRAGSRTRYSFGDDAAMIGDYAWYAANSDETYHEVGQKLPNAWGLYDMHGNVAEIVLDQFDEKAYEQLSDGVEAVPQAIHWGNKTFPDVVRGGAWDYDADDLRSASRGKTADWREMDPNLPKSPWWCTDPPARCVGMRLARPLAEPPTDQRGPYWDADSDATKDAVESRVLNGRGVFGLVDPSLPQAISDLGKK